MSIWKCSVKCSQYIESSSDYKKKLTNNWGLSFFLSQKRAIENVHINEVNTKFIFPFEIWTKPGSVRCDPRCAYKQFVPLNVLMCSPCLPISPLNREEAFLWDRCGPSYKALQALPSQYSAVWHFQPFFGVDPWITGPTTVEQWAFIWKSSRKKTVFLRSGWP